MALKAITIAQFKTACGITRLDVLKNPKTEKWFAVDDKGNSYRCHQATDWSTKPRNVQVLVEDDDMDTACLIPSGLGATVAASY